MDVIGMERRHSVEEAALVITSKNLQTAVETGNVVREAKRNTVVPSLVLAVTGTGRRQSVEETALMVFTKKKLTNGETENIVFRATRNTAAQIFVCCKATISESNPMQYNIHVVVVPNSLL